jgi:hypothetical protein
MTSRSPINGRPTPRRRGRPVVAEDPAVRARHIKAAGMLKLAGGPGDRVAAYWGVSRRTVTLWTRQVLTRPDLYPDPEAEALRRLA